MFIVYFNARAHLPAPSPLDLVLSTPSHFGSSCVPFSTWSMCKSVVRNARISYWPPNRILSVTISAMGLKRSPKDMWSESCMELCHRNRAVHPDEARQQATAVSFCRRGTNTGTAVCSCSVDARSSLLKFFMIFLSPSKIITLRPGPLPSKSFPMNHSTVVVPFSAVIYLLTASLNKSSACCH
jgi:hypothetical protein